MIEVQIREECQHCNQGMVTDPLWLAWHRDHDAYMATHPEAWGPGHNDYEEEHPYPEGDEEYACPDCEGSTWIYRWMPADKLLHFPVT